MDDFDALTQAEAEASDGNKGGVTAAPKASGKAKAKAKGGGGKTASNCFVCEEKKLRNSKFCKSHHRAAENMKYQAQNAKPPELTSYNQVMNDPSKAKIAIEDFMRDNPEGSGRKRLIDWAAWKRDHGVAESDAAFKELLQGPYDREGEGPLTKLWVPKHKERMRDRTHFVESSVTEGSKQLKNSDSKEKESMMQICQSAVGGHDSSFLRSASTKAITNEAGPVKRGPEQVEESDVPPKRVRKGNVADEAPKKYGKLKKDLPGIEKLVSDASDKLKKSIASVQPAADPDAPNDPELDAYMLTGSSRQVLAQLWLCKGLDEALNLIGPKTPSKKPDATDYSSSAAPADPPKDADSKSECKSEAKSEVKSDSKSDAGSCAPRRLSSGAMKSPGEKVSEMLRHAADDGGKGSMAVQSLPQLLSLLEMTELCEKVLNSQGMLELDEKLECWKHSVEQVKLLVAGISKSAQNITSHVANLSRKQKREETKRKKQQESTAVAEAKKMAKAAAKKVKDQEDTVDPIFEVGLDKLQHDMEVAGSEWSEFPTVDEPILFKDNRKISEWANEPKMQLALGSFGGRYKKTDMFSRSGKAQMVLFAKEGKEESHALISNFTAPIPDDNKVKGENDFSKITDTLWLFGYDPALTSISATPNGMAMMKVLAFGEVKWLVMEISSTVAALRAELGVDVIKADDLEALIGSLTYGNLENCKKHGMKAKSCLQRPNEAVFVPAGWIAAEQSVKGVLIYGLRASLLLKSEASCHSYEAYIGLNSASGKPVDKMQQVLDLMQA
ncbi:Uncharacterized protein SCF082_LOCUS21603 [Durusdinium trenchii]|uniref:Uncharacterized protein n=1 Tax=Durusdinium trenchii TaxID=1381693 RepID=A0ABP0LAC9_9DINO